jgi:hypothetical protein
VQSLLTSSVRAPVAELLHTLPALEKKNAAAAASFSFYLFILLKT